MLPALVNGQEGKKILQLQGTWVGLQMNRAGPAEIVFYFPSLHAPHLNQKMPVLIVTDRSGVGKSIDL